METDANWQGFPIHACPYALDGAIYATCPRVAHALTAQPCEGCPTHSALIHHAIAEHARAKATTREELLREVAASYLPRGLRWAVHRPKALGALYRLRPNWRPTVTWGVDGDITVGLVRRADGVMVMV